MPCLFFTDIAVVDSNLEVIDKSFYHMISNSPKTFFKKHSVLLMNIVPGCSMIINKKLKTVALPFNESFYLHDWWFLVIAHFVGKIGFSEKSTFMYRQHSTNTLGANKRSFGIKLSDSIRELKQKENSFDLASDLYERLNQYKLMAEDSVLFNYLRVQNKSKLTRIIFMFKNKLYFKSPIRNFRLVMNVLFKKVK